MKFIYESSNISSYVKSNNFDNFNIDYYPDDYNIDENTDATPRDIIKRILKTSHDFIDCFGKNADNLLIYGHSGVGKTFLTHCIAGEILKKGYSVIYLTSYQLFDILETKVFHSEELDETGSSIISMLYTCDLLIIDDLGTEMINKFTEVQLFACLQERLAGKHSTIISTNLSFDDIKNNYSERIFSRLIGNYKLLKIIGSDIRITKALYENGGTK
jgi:DNA replication protein DnaC